MTGRIMTPYTYMLLPSPEGKASDALLTHPMHIPFALSLRTLETSCLSIPPL